MSDAKFEGAAAIFTALDKTIRSLRLYEGQGALLDRQLDDLAARVAAATEEGELTVPRACRG